MPPRRRRWFSPGERSELTAKLEKLPDIPGLAETPDSKVALTRAWLRCWRNFGFWLAGMPSTWRNRSKSEGVSVKDKKGRGRFEAMNVVIADKGARKIFNDANASGVQILRQSISELRTSEAPA